MPEGVLAREFTKSSESTHALAVGWGTPTTGGVDGEERVQGGRYRTRTDDLFGVNEARYQLRQSP